MSMASDLSAGYEATTRGRGCVPRNFALKGSTRGERTTLYCSRCSLGVPRSARKGPVPIVSHMYSSCATCCGHFFVFSALGELENIVCCPLPSSYSSIKSYDRQGVCYLYESCHIFCRGQTDPRYCTDVKGLCLSCFLLPCLDLLIRC